MRARPVPACLAAALLALGVGCAINPVSGRPEIMLVSEEKEARLGAEAAEQAEADFGVVADPALTAYVAEVGRRVAEQAPRRGFDYVFRIVDLQEPNAFALPGGHVYVSRGLLAIAGNEDQLANVIAHEVVHVAARHHAQRQARAAGVGILALPGLLAGALIGGPVGDLVSAPFSVAGLGVLASYGRDQERQADRVGQQMAARAGYDPAALARFLDVLERDTALAGEEREPSWFDSHPSMPSRAADALAHAREIAFTPRPPVASGADGYDQRVEGLLVGADPAQGVFRDTLYLQPDLGFAIALPEGWHVVNTPNAVGALAPDGLSQVVLQQQGRGSDPREAASSFLSELSQRTRVDVAALSEVEIGSLRAVRGQMVAGSSRGPVSLDLTWIAYGGSIYRITGAVSRGYSDANRAVFEAVARSFRPLTAEERAGIVEWRLRLRPARAGESLAEFGRRSGNAWSPAETAVANGLPEDARLEDGRLLRVAIPEPYRGPGAARGAQ
jgi:predicted Zn-dependent protease